jgi:hypothetical protein
MELARTALGLSGRNWALSKPSIGWPNNSSTVSQLAFQRSQKKKKLAFQLSSSVKQNTTTPSSPLRSPLATGVPTPPRPLPLLLRLLLSPHHRRRTPSSPTYSLPLPIPRNGREVS